MTKATRVVLVTGGMGGLGETISTKMVDAGYKVAVTYSPGNAKQAEWVAQMKSKGYDILAVPCDVADIESCPLIRMYWSPTDVEISIASPSWKGWTRVIETPLLSNVI